MRLFALVSILVVAASAHADWLQFRGPAGLGVSPDKNTPVTWSDKDLAWKVTLPGAGASSPVVMGDKIYLTCYSGYGVPGQPGDDMNQLKRHVLCLNRADGKLLWNTVVESKLPEQPAKKIREGHGYATSTLAVDKDRLYAFFGKSGVMAFDHVGKRLWQADVGAGLNDWGSAASPILWKDLVIVNASVESKSLVAIDKQSGNEVWRAGGINESWNTPILVPLPDGKTELVVAIMGSILGFDPASGAKLWSCKTDIGWYMVPGLVAHDGIVYCIGGRSGGSLAVRAGGKGEVTATHRLWTGKKGSNVSSPIYHDDHLYFAHEGLGILYCVEAKTGRTVYEERAQGSFYASPVLADGKLYYFSRESRGFVVAARPQFEVLARNDMQRGEMFLSSPAVDRGQLLIRTDRYLYCIGSR